MDGSPGDRYSRRREYQPTRRSPSALVPRASPARADMTAWMLFCWAWLHRGSAMDTCTIFAGGHSETGFYYETARECDVVRQAFHMMSGLGISNINGVRFHHTAVNKSFCWSRDGLGHQGCNGLENTSADLKFYSKLIDISISIHSAMTKS